MDSMRTYKYLIVGGGMTAHAALSGIQELDPNSNISLISSDSDERLPR